MTVLRALCIAAVAAASPAAAEEIGSVDTAWKLIGPNHKIVVEAFDDPDIRNVVCHVSRSKTGGLSGAVGLATDPNEASIACRQIGPITLPDGDLDDDEVFSADTDILFKELRVARMIDRRRNVIVYLVYTTKLIDGSPKNVLSTVPILPWPERGGAG